MNVIDVLRQFQIDDKELNEIQANYDVNAILAGYYAQLAEEYYSEVSKYKKLGMPVHSAKLNYDRFITLSERVANCYKHWFSDNYDISKLIDVKSTRLCLNRLCPNCQKKLQATRWVKYSPYLDEAAKTHKLFHTALTVRNVSAKDLLYTVDVLFEAFSRLMLLLNGHYTVKGLDFKQFGYYAAYRALEITASEEKGFHVHLHAMLALSPELTLNKTIINKYSFDKGQLVRKFSEQEILLQKVWRLIVDGIVERDKKLAERRKHENAILDVVGDQPLSAVDEYRAGLITRDQAVRQIFDGKKKTLPRAKRITAQAVKDLSIGYSCTMDEVAEGDYKEVFKYTVKSVTSEHAFISYEQFKAMLFALEGRKCVQGYGAWYNLPAVESADESLVYDRLIEELKKLEMPIASVMDIDVLRDYITARGYLVISRRTCDLNEKLLAELKANGSITRRQQAEIDFEENDIDGYSDYDQYLKQHSNPVAYSAHIPDAAYIMQQKKKKAERDFAINARYIKRDRPVGDYSPDDLPRLSPLLEKKDLSLQFDIDDFL